MQSSKLIVDGKTGASNGWRRVKFGDVVRFVKEDADPDSGEFERYVAGEHIETDNLHIRKWGTVGDGYLGPAFHRRFKKGQVLYGSRRTYLRKIAVAEFDGITANTTFVLEPSGDDLIPELLPFVMQTETFTQHSIKQSKGSVNPYINFKDIAWFEFALPPKDEQRRIAEILWSADEARRALDQVVIAAEKHKRSLLDQELSLGHGQRKPVPLHKVCEMQNGRSFSSALYHKTGPKLLRPGNLGIDGYLDWRPDATRCLPQSILTEASRYVVNPGDVVINLTAQSLEDGFMGRVCLAKSERDRSLLNQRIGRFVCRDCVLPEFLFRCFQTRRFRGLVESSCEGSKIKHLYWRHFADFEIPLPPKDEQTQIAKLFQEVETAVGQAVRHTCETRELHVSLLHNLLTARKNV